MLKIVLRDTSMRDKKLVEIFLLPVNSNTIPPMPIESIVMRTEVAVAIQNCADAEKILAWKPMKEAPKDGTVIAVCGFRGDDLTAGAVYFDDLEKTWCDYETVCPTQLDMHYWKELPFK